MLPSCNSPIVVNVFFFFRLNKFYEYNVWSESTDMVA